MMEAAHAAGNRGRLGEWVSAKEGFIEADVIRWTEGIYEKRRGKKAKARRLGERQVTAEVIESTGDGWLNLLVRACVITKDDYAGGRMPTLLIGNTIKRARKTVERGKPERLLWSDEGAREAVLECACSLKTSGRDRPVSREAEASLYSPSSSPELKLDRHR